VATAIRIFSAVREGFVEGREGSIHLILDVFPQENLLQLKVVAEGAKEWEIRHFTSSSL
jgi:hypothetical protein